LSKTKCFSCGILGHVAKYCRKSNASGTKSFVRTKQHSTTKINEDHRSGSIYVSRLANEAVMFIKSKVNGLNANMLVDTGATVTLVSIKLFETWSAYSLSESISACHMHVLRWFETLSLGIHVHRHAQLY
jgi:hypothetical protein